MADKKVNKLLVLKEIMEMMDTLRDNKDIELTINERVHLNTAYTNIYAAWEGN